MVTNCQRAYYTGLESATSALARAEQGPGARAQAVHAAFEAPAGADLACRAGCAHCCSFPVGVRLAEAALLAAEIARDPALRARVLADAATRATASWNDLVGRPCPLLRDGACSCYGHRPLPCRALASRDDDACRRALRAEGSTPRDEEGWWRGLGAAAALDDELGPRELRAALAALLVLDRAATPTAIEAAFGAARGVPGSAS